jgi:hypothetical protein
MILFSINWTTATILGCFILLMLIFLLNLDNLAESKSKFGKYVFSFGIMILSIFIILMFLDGIVDFFNMPTKPSNDEYYDPIIRR